MRPALFPTIAVAILFAGCSPSLTKGIVYSESANPLVKNGTAYDIAELELGYHRTVVLPSRADVQTSDLKNVIRIELTKGMGFMGHPGGRMMIDSIRNGMGCAWKSDGDKLQIATFGEFDSGIEGGYAVELTVFVPNDIQVERDDSYEMPRTGEGGGSKLSRYCDEGSEWYSLKEAGEKWIPIADQPDVRRATRAAK